MENKKSNIFSIQIESRNGKKNFSNWSIPVETANSIGITKPEYKYIIIKTDDNKLSFEGKFRISSKGPKKGFQIVMPKSFSNEIILYNEKHKYKKLNFEIRELTDINYMEYYIALKYLRQLHQKYKFGSSPKLPEKFSESLSRYLLNLSKSSLKIFDAIDRDENNIEIKASTTFQGTVTINPNSKFDIIYWLYFNFNEDKLIIKKGDYTIFADEFIDKETRYTITLLNFLDEKSLYKIYELDVVNKKIKIV